MLFGIFIMNKHIGTVTLKNINHYHKNAKVSYALGIKELLTVQRQNGLGNLITRIVGLAQ